MAKKEETPKKAATRKPAAKKMARGDCYVCEVCGLEMTVDDTCNCVDVCDIICCGEPMQAKST